MRLLRILSLLLANFGELIFLAFRVAVWFVNATLGIITVTIVGLACFIFMVLFSVWYLLGLPVPEPRFEPYE